MSDKSVSGSRSGGCLCGAVRFTATPKDCNLGVCHCGMCRRWSAGPFLAVDCGPTLHIADASQLGVYRSSDWAERAFCRQCGASLFYRLVESGFSFVSSEAFDDRFDFVFTSEIFIDEKPPYYAFANATKKMTGAEAFAAFGAEQAGTETKG